MVINMIDNTGAPVPKPTARDGGPVQAERASRSAPDAAPAPERRQLPQPRTEELSEAVETMRQLVESKAPNSLQFSIDDATGRTVVKISDAKTGETIRQIPSEEMLELARSLDKMQGMLLEQEA